MQHGLQNLQGAPKYDSWNRLHTYMNGIRRKHQELVFCTSSVNQCTKWVHCKWPCLVFGAYFYCCDIYHEFSSMSDFRDQHVCTLCALFIRLNYFFTIIQRFWSFLKHKFFKVLLKVIIIQEYIKNIICTVINKRALYCKKNM